MRAGYNLKLSGFGVLASSSSVEASDTPSICLRKALAGHAQAASKPQPSSPSPKANAAANQEQLRYVYMPKPQKTSLLLYFHTFLTAVSICFK